MAHKLVKCESAIVAENGKCWLCGLDKCPFPPLIKVETKKVHAKQK